MIRRNTIVSHLREGGDCFGYGGSLQRRDARADIGIGVTGCFGNVDPNNADSTPGEVYFAIADKNGTKPYHCTLPVQSTRLSYKLYISEVIVDKLRQPG